MQERPFFSVVVVCLNAEAYIGKTMHSILAQTCDDFEVIVKDGGSEDATLSLVPKDDRVRIYCQPDSGIYDAMNQATARARGHYTIYMNCGDTFYSDTVLERVRAAVGNASYALVYGDYVRNGIRHRHAARITSFYLYRTSMCHQALFFNTDVLHATTPYDTRYTIMADYDLELRLHRSNDAARYVDLVICEYLGGGFSENPARIARREKERGEIRRKHFSRMQNVLYFVRWKATFPKLRGKLLGGACGKGVARLYQKVVNLINRR